MLNSNTLKTGKDSTSCMVNQVYELAWEFRWDQSCIPSRLHTCTKRDSISPECNQNQSQSISVEPIRKSLPKRHKYPA